MSVLRSYLLLYGGEDRQAIRVAFRSKACDYRAAVVTAQNLPPYPVLLLKAGGHLGRIRWRQASLHVDTTALRKELTEVFLKDGCHNHLRSLAVHVDQQKTHHVRNVRIVRELFACCAERTVDAFKT